MVIAKTALGIPDALLPAPAADKRLENLLIFSCNSLVRSRNRFGDY